jgi:2-polyprenyl-3-methyl-5-hydroxy-6-metoxy-1,4-benzoquinol methylase
LNLQEHRQRAAALSGGTSNSNIKELVIRLLKAGEAQGPLLDFGAGQGELLRHFSTIGLGKPLSGADIAARPATLPQEVEWFTQDLNEPLRIGKRFGTVVCSETIEHLENPRLVFRNLAELLIPGGTLVLTMPNQECIRSYVGLILGGHFTHFLGTTYPAHITALLRMDLQRLCGESGFEPPVFAYTGDGGIPKIPRISWQAVSFGLLNGRLYSDNVGMVTRKRPSAA